jgi:hypothetical protein
MCHFCVTFCVIFAQHDTARILSRKTFHLAAGMHTCTLEQQQQEQQYVWVVATANAGTLLVQQSTPCPPSGVLI